MIRISSAVDPAAGRAGDQADEAADDHARGDDHDSADEPARPHAVEDPAEDVAADLVGAEQEAAVERGR